MAWSKLRARWRELLASSVAKRVDIHMAGYHKAYEGRGRIWVALEGRPILSFCEFQFENAVRIEGRKESPTGWPFSSTAMDKVEAAEIHRPTYLLDALGKCIGSPIDELLASPDPIVRALAMLDRRLGKRRLAQIDPHSEHRWVALFHKIRTESDAYPPMVARSKKPSTPSPQTPEL